MRDLVAQAVIALTLIGVVAAGIWYENATGGRCVAAGHGFVYCRAWGPFW